LHIFIFSSVVKRLDWFSYCQEPKRAEAFGCRVSYQYRSEKTETVYKYYSNILDLAANSQVLFVARHIVNLGLLMCLRCVESCWGLRMLCWHLMGDLVIANFEVHFLANPLFTPVTWCWFPLDRCLQPPQKLSELHGFCSNPTCYFLCLLARIYHNWRKV